MILIKLFVTFSVILLTHRVSSDFCGQYKCICNATTIRDCHFNKSVASIDFLEPGIRVVDLSGHGLSKFFFGDTTLSVEVLSLSNNKIETIQDEFFIHMPHLHALDLSNNRINSLPEITFQNTNTLRKINMSRAFIDKYEFSRELCELISLQIIDLSYLNLEYFTLECWHGNSAIHIHELHLSNTKNADKSSFNWLPYIGEYLRFIDLTNAGIYQIDPSLANQAHLTTMILSGNGDLIKDANKMNFFKVLQTNNLIGQLESLELSNLNLSSQTFPWHKLLSNLNESTLNYIDISFNNYDDDLSEFFFNQKHFSNLTVFKASHNRFRNCKKELVAREESTLFNQLEHLDLSNNMIEDLNCFRAIKPIHTLRHLDLHKNHLVTDNETADPYLFTQMYNLTHLDLSENLLTDLRLALTPQHIHLIKKFDFSKNLLSNFQFFSLTRQTRDASELAEAQNIKKQKKAKKNPSKNDNNGDKDKTNDKNDFYDDDQDDYDDENDDEYYDDDYYDDDYDGDFDDERFITIDVLDLSENKLMEVNVRRMLQTISNIIELDMSLNPIEQVINLSSKKFTIAQFQNETNVKEDPMPLDPYRRILCIDHFDLTNCELFRMPSMEHTCLNKLSLGYNQLRGQTHLVVSMFSLYFLDYLDLQMNNISDIKFVLSSQKFKQDDKKSFGHNSPESFMMSKKNSTFIHTRVDLKRNIAFKCSCEMYKHLKEIKTVTVLHNCYNPQFMEDCDNQMNAGSFTLLNYKFRLFFISVCLFISLISCVVIYYVIRDCHKNIDPYERFRYSFNCLFKMVKCKRSTFSSNPMKLFETISSPSSSSLSSSLPNDKGGKSSKVVYKRLEENDQTMESLSNINIIT
jgi:Leucine-rich repeat (LRR) protein